MQWEDLPCEANLVTGTGVGYSWGGAIKAFQRIIGGMKLSEKF